MGIPLRSGPLFFVGLLLPLPPVWQSHWKLKEEWGSLSRRPSLLSAFPVFFFFCCCFVSFPWQNCLLWRPRVIGFCFHQLLSRKVVQYSGWSYASCEFFASFGRVDTAAPEIEKAHSQSSHWMCWLDFPVCISVMGRQLRHPTCSFSKAL